MEGLKKRGLGKGLDAIFAENTTEDSEKAVILKLSEIEPNREQPRRDFDEAALEELAQSIAQHGVLQPLLVRPLPGGVYQIVAGERRWRASRMAGIKTVPAIVREMSDSEMMELALVENLQREDLSVIEEAEGYQVLIHTYEMTQEEVAKAVGKSRPAITNALRILNLPQEVREMLAQGKISAGHARTLLSFSDEESMRKAAKLVCEKHLSVRDLEKMAKKPAEPLQTPKTKRNTYFDEVELALKEQLSRRVQIQNKGKKGVLQIEFYGEDDLKDFLQKFFKE